MLAILFSLNILILYILFDLKSRPIWDPLTGKKIDAILEKFGIEFDLKSKIPPEIWDLA